MKLLSNVFLKLQLRASGGNIFFPSISSLYEEDTKRPIKGWLCFTFVYLTLSYQRFSCRGKLGTSVGALFLLSYFICETIRLSVTERKL